jgi:hypothetical protein
MQQVVTAALRERQNADLSAITTEHQGGAGAEDDVVRYVAEGLSGFHHLPG